MAPLVSCITPTGYRPEAFALCKHYMARQTFKDFEWIVIDDSGLESPSFDLPMTIIQPDFAQKDPGNTLCRNLSLALELAQGKYIAFVEDDDWYSARWLQIATDRLEADKLCGYGEECAKYYNLQSRQYQTLSNTGRASLCQTVMHRSYIELMMAIIAASQNTPFVDIPLWHELGKAPHYLAPVSREVIGIKSMPGRRGIGIGHNLNRGWEVDIDGSILATWIGDDVNLYIPYIGRE